MCIKIIRLWGWIAWSHLPKMGGWHAHEEQTGPAAVDVELEPIRPRLECHLVAAQALDLFIDPIIVVEWSPPDYSKTQLLNWGRRVCNGNRHTRVIKFNISISIYSIYENLQNLHLGSLPPKVRVEHQNISVSPMPRMLLDWLRPNGPVRYPVMDGIVGVWLHQQRRPIEIDRCIVILLCMHNRNMFMC